MGGSGHGSSDDEEDTEFRVPKATDFYAGKHFPVARALANIGWEVEIAEIEVDRNGMDLLVEETRRRHLSEVGEIDANIKSKTVAVSGSVMGNVHATSKVVVHKTGRIEGDIETTTIVIEEGAIINGAIRMGKSGSVKAVDGGTKTDEQQNS